MKIAAVTAAAALTALLVAGCGGDNKSVSTSTAAASGGAASTAAGTATTARGGTAATTAASSSGGDSTTAPSFSGDSNNKFCQTARDLENSDLGGSLSGEGGDLKGDLQKIRSAFDDLKNSAPSDIKSDVATLATAFDKLDAFYAKYDYDQAKLTAAATKDPAVLAEATSALTDADVATATSRITAYAAQVCGIDDSSSTSA
jgi:hypothetical protein